MHQANNAGIAYNGNVDKSVPRTRERIIDVDFWASSYRHQKPFCCIVIVPGDGHIVNISSLFGLIAPGRRLQRAARGARLLTEALRQEMLVARHPSR